MTQLVHLTIRLFSITIGYFAACMTAAIMYAFLSGYIRLDDFEIYGELDTSIALALNVAFLSTQFAKMSFLISFAIIILFEIRKIQDWLVYIISSGAIAIASPFIYAKPEFIFPLTFFYVASAMSGGLVYWLFVGQRAGNWNK